MGTSRAEIDGICGGTPAATIDGIPAYPFCGNFDVWTKNGVDTQSTSGGSGWIRTETNFGYQCAELALRYFRFRYGITTVWPNISYADQMCGTHPAGVSVTNTPVHGDLLVIQGGTCGTTNPGGHVAVVDKVNASSVDVVQENPGAAVTWASACVKCYLHAAHNNGTNDPCEASTTDGTFCGQTIKLVNGTTGTLYQCAAGATTSSKVCAGGCVTGAPDACAAEPLDASADVATKDATPPVEEDAAPEAAPPVVTPPPASSGGCSSAGGPPSAWWLVGLVLLARKLSYRRGRTTRSCGRSAST